MRRLFVAILLIALLSVCRCFAEDADLTGGVLLRVTADAELTYTPPVNGVYEAVFFPDEGAACHIDIFQDDEALSEGDGIASARLTAGKAVTLKLSVTGSGYIEMARQARSRSFTDPLTLGHDGYAKSLVRGGDVHWFAMDAPAGTLLLSAASDDGIPLAGDVFDGEGHYIASVITRDGGFFYAETVETSGVRYLRVSAPDGNVGRYRLNYAADDVAVRPSGIGLPRSRLTVDGRRSLALSLTIQPENACRAAVWLSSDNTVATVDGNGVVTTRSPGVATVTACTAGGLQVSCTVTVTNVPVTGIDLPVSELNLITGETLVLPASVIPENASVPGIAYASEDDDVVTIDASGVMTAVGVGHARVAAISEDGGKTAVVFINVTEAPPRYRALILCNETYPATVETTRTGSVYSAECLAELFGTASFDGEGMSVTRAYDVSRDDALKAIRETFRAANDRDLSVIYLSGHGLTAAGTSHLLMSDGSVLSARDLAIALADIRGDIVILADFCYAGGLVGATDRTDVLLAPSLAMNNRIRVISSAAMDEDSYRMTFESSLMTVFVRAFCDACGWDTVAHTAKDLAADRNHDGSVTLAELSSYLPLRIRSYLRRAGNYTQTVSVAPFADDFPVFQAIYE
ncbi:MAG: Ig-like domain-containing protein [Clostridia bacterium]|nr:Ig-like domain-containing protein [Clostridia bacterium]